MEQIKNKGNFGRVYVLLLQSELSPYAKLCFGVMTSFGVDSRAKLETIAHRMSVSIKTVRAAQKELLEAGWIVLLQEGVTGHPREWETQVTPSKGTLRGYPTPAEDGTAGEPNREALKREESISKQRSDPMVIKMGFDMFKDMYPKIGNLFKASEEWQELSPDKPLIDEIIKGLGVWVNSTDWKNEEGMYIPSGAKFIVEKRWMDEPRNNAADTVAACKHEIDWKHPKLRKVGRMYYGPCIHCGRGTPHEGERK